LCEYSFQFDSFTFVCNNLAFSIIIFALFSKHKSGQRNVKRVSEQDFLKLKDYIFSQKVKREGSVEITVAYILASKFRGLLQECFKKISFFWRYTVIRKEEGLKLFWTHSIVFIKSIVTDYDILFSLFRTLIHLPARPATLPQVPTHLVLGLLPHRHRLPPLQTGMIYSYIISKHWIIPINANQVNLSPRYSLSDGQPPLNRLFLFKLI